MKTVKFLMILIWVIFMALASSTACAKNDPGTPTEEIAADKEAINSQRVNMKSNAESAKAEEQAVRNEIREARQSGDAETAEALKKRLRTTHRENVAERRQDKKTLHEAKKELKRDVRSARKNRR
ncbi:MAG: hypothetical protein WC482_00615 [Candidatus Omnitrophota bacterium]|jgi:biopolymer transport protein ExbB/TolQ